MGDVIPIKGEKYIAGNAFCMACKHQWVATAPAGTVDFECPNCGRFTGTFKGQIIPTDPVWECGCGNTLFYRLPGGVTVCPVCGIHEEAHDEH